MTDQIWQEISSVANAAHGTSLDDILHRRCSSEVIESLAKYIKWRKQVYCPPLLFGFLVTPGIARAFIGHDGWKRLRDFCAEVCGENFIAPSLLLECLLAIFDDHNGAAWVGRGVVARKVQHLRYDEDGLLVVPQDPLRFTREGVLTPNLMLLYDYAIPGDGVEGSFVDGFLALAASVKPCRCGIAVSQDYLMESSLRLSRRVKAFIRGPKGGLKIDRLQSDTFPRDSRGEVTVHRRIDSDPLHVLFPLDRLEVMWSQREGIKSIQMEELRLWPTSSTSFPCVFNRYVHARWDPRHSAFVHFDGAIRGYGPVAYKRRMGEDLRQRSGKSDSYRKLFRMDGIIPLESWAEMVVRFFERNELVLEYVEVMG